MAASFENLIALVPHVAGVLLYHRITAEIVLETRMRRRVFARIVAFPGSTATDVARALDVDYKTITHHARFLEKFGFVTKEKDGRSVRYYAVRGVGDGDE